MSNVIYLRQPVRQAVAAPKEAQVSLLKYSLVFARNLFIWLLVGAVLALFLPGWAISLLCIGLLFIEKMPKK
jgi:hypothetical protein